MFKLQRYIAPIPKTMRKTQQESVLITRQQQRLISSRTQESMSCLSVRLWVNSISTMTTTGSNTIPTTLTSRRTQLQYTLADSDKRLWDTMDQATYETIEQMSTRHPSPSPSKGLEYWCSDDGGNAGYWSQKHPTTKEIRIPGIVHETSTAFMGPEDEGGSVDEHYRPHGIKNVYVTGGALFPTAGSWNPTMAMCGFAQHLSRELNKPSIQTQAEA